MATKTRLATTPGDEFVEDGYVCIYEALPTVQDKGQVRRNAVARKRAKARQQAVKRRAARKRAAVKRAKLKAKRARLARIRARG